MLFHCMLCEGDKFQLHMYVRVLVHVFEFCTHIYTLVLFVMYMFCMLQCVEYCTMHVLYLMQ